MADTFVSYSRQNLEFVRQLVDALKKCGKDPWFDQLKEPLAGIVAGAPWWKEIQYGIENADNFLFVISPNSISSPYCHAEINYARERGKRLVPVLYCGWIGEGEIRKAIDAAIETIHDDAVIPDNVTSSILNLKKLARENWLAISEIQYVVFSSSMAFDQSLEQLIQALDLDLAWVKMHSQLVQAAKLWEASGFDDDFLWRGNRLKPIYEMIERRKPDLDALVQEFIRLEQDRLLREIANIKTDHQRRHWIGERLAAIGDLRSGIGLDERGMPQIDWLLVSPGGDLTIKEQSFTIQPFHVAKYLITYGQFQAFLDAPDGFGDARWWQGFPDQLVRQEIGVATAQYNNYPRDSVSWYQCVAFTRWLDAKYHEYAMFKQSLLNQWQLRLPTEWEWQWMAQNGSEAREYPWGIWDEHPRANTTEAGIGDHVTAVGMYPNGAAACGAMDVAGNLWEWCLNNYEDIPFVEVDGSNDHRVRRGGSFFDTAHGAACKFRRHRHDPTIKNHLYGFRVVIGPVLRL